MYVVGSETLQMQVQSASDVQYVVVGPRPSRIQDYFVVQVQSYLDALYFMAEFFRCAYFIGSLDVHISYVGSLDTGKLYFNGPETVISGWWYVSS